LIRKEVKMLKKALFVVAAVAMLGAVANAGNDVSFKSHGFSWTKVYTPVEISGVNVKVKMDIGYWIKIPNGKKLEIKLGQDDIYTYSGNTDMTVMSNFALTLSSEITKTGTVDGKYTSWVSPADLGAGTNVTKVYAKLENADLSGTTVGNDVHVADIKIKVVPQ